MSPGHPFLALLGAVSSTCYAASALLNPAFTEQQQQVRQSSARAPDLSAKVAAFHGITEARLAGNEPGRVTYLIAQYLAANDFKNEQYSSEEQAWAIKQFRNGEWGMAVIRPFAQEAKQAGLQLCPTNVDAASCYYYILSKDMHVRLMKAKEPTRRD